MSALFRAIADIQLAVCWLPPEDGMPQAYYVSFERWQKIRDELMAWCGGIPKVDMLITCSFFQLLGVPVIAFEAMED